MHHLRFMVIALGLLAGVAYAIPPEYQFFQNSKYQVIPVYDYDNRLPFNGIESHTYSRDSSDDEDDTYVGEWRDGKPHGFGKRNFGSDISYVGIWKNGVIDGLGKMIFADGAVYDGVWDYIQGTGSGKMTYPDGYKWDVYVGQWKSGRPHGLGKMTYRDDRHDDTGEWRDGQFLRETTLYNRCSKCGNNKCKWGMVPNFWTLGLTETKCPTCDGSGYEHCAKCGDNKCEWGMELDEGYSRVEADGLDLGDTSGEFSCTACDGSGYERPGYDSSDDPSSDSSSERRRLLERLNPQKP